MTIAARTVPVPLTRVIAATLTLPVPLAVIARLPEYSAAPQSTVPLLFRASSNESAYPAASAVVRAAQAAVAMSNRYPVINATDVITAVAGFVGVAPAAIAVADGALSLLQHVLSAYVHPGQEVIYAWRSYEAYPICVQLAGGIPRQVSLTSAHEHDLDGMLAAIGANTAAVILCNPNNPTGTAFGRHELIRFLDRVPSHVVVVYDEAYRDFVDPARIAPFESSDLLARYPNLIALRTFSKVYSLAGMRVGYLIASETIAGIVRRVIPPFPLTAASAAAAIAALDEDDARLQVVSGVHEERERVITALATAGYVAAPSHGNFVWLPIGADAEPFARHLRESGIAIRAFPGDGARISLGEPGLAEALTAALASRPGRAVR